MTVVSNGDQADKREKIFQIFKYVIYFMLFLNLIYFMREDFLASGHTFRDGVNLSDLGNAFTASIDTVAWFVLLILLELETYTMEAEHMHGKRQMLVNIASAICYGFILLALVGYVDKASIIYGFEPVTVASACDFVGQYLSMVNELDDYGPLTATSCLVVDSGGAIWVNEAHSMVSGNDALSEARRLAMTDVVNASTWVLIVLILELDVFLQLRGGMSEKMQRINLWIKGLLYSTLTVCLLYWVWMGDVVGSWDAFLWLVAFVFIEMNMFDWRKEELEEQTSQGAA